MKKFFKIFLVFFFLWLFFLSSPVFADVSQRRIFFDSFEDGLGAWQITSSAPNTVEVATDKVRSGAKSVKFDYQDGSKYLEALYSFSSQTNIVLQGWFYDDLSSTKGVAFGLWDKNSGSHTILGVMTTKFAGTYFIRHNSFSNMYDSGVPRTQGWHLFEIIVTPQGAYGKIDNQFLANFKNTAHTQANQIGIYTTWSLTGTSWFDDIDILTANQNPEEEVKSLIQRYLYLYQNTDFSPIYPILGRDDIGGAKGYGNALRSILDLAYAFAFDWKVNNHQDSLNKSIYFLKVAVDNGHWDKHSEWAIALPSIRLIRTAAVVWDFLDDVYKEKILVLAEQIANKVKDYPIASGYVNDTRAEDNAWNAAFLSTISQFYNSHVNASLWEEKGKCFAWHSITTSRDPQFCGVKTQTVWDDFQLDNHDRHPNPGYTGATIYLLAEGGFPYRALGKPTPQEFKHNVSPLFQKLLTYTIAPSYHYEINGQPFADWSGVTDTFYYPACSLDFINSENLGGNIDILSLKNNVFKSRSLFYADVVNQLVEKPLEKLETFDQSNNKSDGFKFLLNSAMTGEVLILDYFWNYPQGAFRSLKWQVQDQGKTWQPAVWGGGPMINYETQNNQLVFSLQSQQPSNAEVYSSLISVEPNKTYLVSYQVKTENLEGNGQYPGAVIASEYNSSAQEGDKLTDNRLHDGKRSNIPVFRGTNNWQDISYRFTTTANTKG